MTSMRIRVLALAVLAGLLFVSFAAHAAPVRIPFVGCASDGQIGPEPAPRGTTKAVLIDPYSAARLAFYQSKYAGVIAPRGWQCFTLEGSDGSILFVTPSAHSAADLMQLGTRFGGPAIQLSTSLGDTSGRFAVAEISARYFPARRKFVDSVIAEGIKPAAAFVFAPFPADRFIRRTPRLVEVETPAHALGMGTTNRLAPDALPIRSIAAIGEGDAPDVTVLIAKLAPEQRELLPAILAQVR
ncbi:MAG TPA: hypothetical protein VHZ78_14355 [Rhizomicrobium sp.]|nr:hypothetical protein [Rhizomicrobium sp.]